AAVDVGDTAGAKPLPGRATGYVVFRDVWFAYRGGPPVLRGIDLDLAPGDTIALVGASGAGKSTLASLLVRFFDPTRGQILLDGHDLRAITLRSLRDSV